MTVRDSFVEEFDAENGVIGYTPDGRIWTEEDGPTGSFPVYDAIGGIKNPAVVAAAVASAEAGTLEAPVESWGEVAGLIVTRDGVRAELDMPDDSYEQQLTFAEFAPILAAWQAAWNSAQAQLARTAAYG